MTENNNGEKLQKYLNAEFRKDIDNLGKHAEIANKEMGEVKTLLGILSNDVGWLKKFFWIVAGASIGGLIAGVLNLLIK